MLQLHNKKEHSAKIVLWVGIVGTQRGKDKQGVCNFIFSCFLIDCSEGLIILYHTGVQCNVYAFRYICSVKSDL